MQECAQAWTRDEVPFQIRIANELRAQANREGRTLTDMELKQQVTVAIVVGVAAFVMVVVVVVDNVAVVSCC